MVIYFDRDISYYTFKLLECLVCHLELNVCWLKGHGSVQELIGDCGHYVDARSDVTMCLMKGVSID